MAVAILVDRLLGDPPNRYHPTAWAGGMIARMIPAFGDNTGAPRRLWGAVVVVASCTMVTVLAALALWGIISAPAVLAQQAIGDPRTGDHPHLLAAVSWAAIIAVYAATILLLKSTIAVRGMERHAAGVSSRLEEGDVRGAGGRPGWDVSPRIRVRDPQRGKGDGGVGRTSGEVTSQRSTHERSASRLARGWTPGCGRRPQPASR